MKIERIENGRQGELPTAYYVNVRNAVENQGDTFSGGHNTRWHFYGCPQEAVKSIVYDEVSGFKATLAGSSVRSLWGPGVYFARDASYSNDYCPPASNG